VQGALAEQVDSVDYVELRDAESLAPLSRVEGPAVVLVAALVGRTRLIDNMRVT
jgi:pantoate--beta-alanine ligase